MLSLGIEVIQEPNISIQLKNTEEIGLAVEQMMREEVTTSDYESLKNKPRLNGTEIIGDMEELDPTVPPWAKLQDKPKYTAEETGSIDVDSALTLEEIDRLFNMV